MKIGLLYFVALLFSLTAQGQHSHLNDLLDSAGSVWYADFDKTDRLVKQGEEFITANGLKGNEANLIELYNFRVQSCNAFKRFHLWRQYVDELSEFVTKNKNALSPQEYTLFRLRNELARAQYYDAINDSGKALELFLSVLAEFKKLPRSVDVCENLYSISNDVADIHLRNGEYEASVNQFLAVIPYVECSSIGEPDLSLVYRNIGAVYLKKKDYKQAGRYLKQAENSVERSLKRSPLERSQIALSLYETLSTYYEVMGSYDSALISMQKALPLFKLANVGDSFKGRISLRIGDLNVKAQKFTAAQSYYSKAEKFFLNSQDNQSVYLANLYLAKANLFDKLGKPDLALASCQDAMSKLVLDFKPNADGNPSLVTMLSKRKLFTTLQKKSRLLEKQFNKSKNVKMLVSAFHTNQLSLALIDSIANEVSLDKDKVNLVEDSYSAFEDGIRMAHTLYQQTLDKQYLADCFALIDKSKGIVLLEKLRLVDRFAGINPEWVNREKEIKSELILTEQNIYQLELKNQKSHELAPARERYASLKHDYGDLMNKIKAEAPAYYQLRFDRKVIGVSEIQNKLLHQGEALLEYFVGDSILVVAGFTKDNQSIQIKKLPGDFTSKINELRTLIITSDQMTNSRSFETLAAELYDFLIKDVLHELGSDITSLTIIPDGELGYLPFEVLRKTNEGSNVYAIEAFRIRYAYSATYLNEQVQTKSSQADQFFAGFVPSYDKNIISYDRSSGKRLSTLPGAEKEVKAITELLGNHFSVFSPALKDDFKEHASDYRVLHLAMHSQVNNENPMLSVMTFSATEADSSGANQLTAIELYNMNLKSDLAVLSACNTGYGKLHRGEGIMSFSRAFAYAGVPSAVISLWQVPDKATSKIMVNFYKNLKEGKNKDHALQQAKLDFIKEYPQMSAPLFWSGFVLTGNREALEFPSQVSLWLLMTGLAMAGITGVVILIVFFRKSRVAQ